VRWAERLPDALRGVVIGNEVLDAMPVKLLARQDGQWFERGVAVSDRPAFTWQDRPTSQRPPVEIGGAHDYVTEDHAQARAFVATLAEKLRAGGAGAAYVIDYGFPEAEYWHPERSAGTLVCHRAHRMDDDPLADVGGKDITAHVDFTGIALAAQEGGLDVLGYTSQGRFLINCGIAPMMAAADLPARATALKLLAEHEMGELFKVIGLATPGHGPALGFAAGDRTDRL
jgi:SAM-dependent MidA family methyltransferase